MLSRDCNKACLSGANSQQCVAACFYCSMTKWKKFTKTKWKCYINETGVTFRWFKSVPFFSLEVWLNCMEKGNCPPLNEWKERKKKNNKQISILLYKQIKLRVFSCVCVQDQDILIFMGVQSWQMKPFQFVIMHKR